MKRAIKVLAFIQVNDYFGEFHALNLLYEEVTTIRKL